MGILLKGNTDTNFADYLEEYLSSKPPDCILYSADGHNFQIHKVIFDKCFSSITSTPSP